MKLILSILTLVFSINAFASSLEDLVGKYRAKDGDGMARVTKILVKERNLFEPDEYVYRLEIERRKHDIARVLDLQVRDDKKSLLGSDRDDCDDPDCHAFNSFEAIVEKKTGKAQVKIMYEGYDSYDGEDEIDEFSGEVVFYKVR